MKPSIFDLSFQHDDLASKITAGLERISVAFRTLLWEHAKVIGLSPIQIQILIFIAYHQEQLCNITQLAQEFNLTKPTVSDAVKVLVKKKLVEKNHSIADKRAYTLFLTTEGKKVVAETENFAHPVQQIIENFGATEKELLWKSLSQLIFTLNQQGVITVQKTCFGCRYYQKQQDGHFCQLLQKPLADKDIRLDCPEFEQAF